MNYFCAESKAVLLVVVLVVVGHGDAHRSHRARRPDVDETSRDIVSRRRHVRRRRPEEEEAQGELQPDHRHPTRRRRRRLRSTRPKFFVRLLRWGESCGANSNDSGRKATGLFNPLIR